MFELPREIKFRAWDKKNKKWIRQEDFVITGDGEIEKDIILLQYTGLHDKNGKEIYEGDILEYKNTGAWGRFIVKWNKEGFWDVGLDCSESEIVGNVFENPNLMKNLQEKGMK